MNGQETAIDNGSRWLDGLGGPGRGVPRIIARSRDDHFPLPNVRVGSGSTDSEYPLHVHCNLNNRHLLDSSGR